MNEILVVEKPETVSWKEISAVLRQAHARNDQQGIVSRYPHLPPDQLQQQVEGHGGKLFVALDAGRVVGTGAVIRVEKELWCHHGSYAYCFLDAVLPDYAGKGIFRRIEACQQQQARAWGEKYLLLDTDERNRNMLRICWRMGYRPIEYRMRDDHNSVVFVKSLGPKMPSRLYCLQLFLRIRWKRRKKARAGS